MAIRARTSPLLRRVRSALRSGLAAQLAAINTDLTAESAGYSLPSVASADIEIAAQGGVLPEVAARPMIRIWPTRAPEESAAIGDLTMAEVRVTASVFLRLGDLTISPAPSTSQEREGTLMCAALDMAEAVKRVMASPASIQTSTAEGIAIINRVEVDPRLENTDDSDYVCAVRADVTAVYRQRRDT